MIDINKFRFFFPKYRQISGYLKNFHNFHTIQFHLLLTGTTSKRETAVESGEGEALMDKERICLEKNDQNVKQQKGNTR